MDEAGATKLTITQEDPCHEAGGDGDNGEDGDNDGEAENPVLSALKRLVESLSSTAPEG